MKKARIVSYYSADFNGVDGIYFVFYPEKDEYGNPYNLKSKIEETRQKLIKEDRFPTSSLKWILRELMLSYEVEDTLTFDIDNGTFN